MKNDGKLKAGKKIFAILLISTLVYTAAAVSASAADKKSGAWISVVLTDGRKVEGELVAVKAQSLVLADSVAMTSSEVAVGEIVRVLIVRKSRILSGLGIGLLVGAASGVLLGFAGGDDAPGFFSFSAAEKAGIGAGILGLIGAPVGALAGGIKGVDQNIYWANMTPGDREKTLQKLRTISRFPREYAAPVSSSPTASRQPADVPPPSKTAQTSQPSSMTEDRSTVRPRFSRFHLGITPAYFKTEVIKRLERTVEAAGFGEDIRYSAGWFSSSAWTAAYPRIGEDDAFFLNNIHLEYSFTFLWAVGFLYAPLGRHQVDGHRAMKGLDYRTGFNADCYLSGRYSGNAYFLTVAFYPVPDGFIRKFTVRAGSGIGLVQADISFSDNLFPDFSSYRPVDDRGLKVSGFAPAVLAFGELHYFFNRHWSLGLTVDYKYVPLRVGAAVIQTSYSYYASGYPDYDFHEESLAVSLPEQNLNFGGFSFGLSLRIHL